MNVLFEKRNFNDWRSGVYLNCILDGTKRAHINVNPPMHWTTKRTNTQHELYEIIRKVVV